MSKSRATVLSSLEEIREFKEPWERLEEQSDCCIFCSYVCTTEWLESFGDLVEPAHLHFSPPATTPCNGEAVSINLRIPSAEFSLDRVVDQTLDLVLNRCQGNKSRAAEVLQISYKTLLAKIKELRVDPPEP